MRKFVLIIFLYLISCSHNSDNLIGKWGFVDFYNLKSSDTSRQKEARNFWRHYKMHFSSNNQYESEGIFPDTAKWHFNEKDKSIKLTYTSGSEDILNVIKLD